MKRDEEPTEQCGNSYGRERKRERRVELLKVVEGEQPSRSMTHNNKNKKGVMAKCARKSTMKCLLLLSDMGKIMVSLSNNILTFRIISLCFPFHNSSGS